MALHRIDLYTAQQYNIVTTMNPEQFVDWLAATANLQITPECTEDAAQIITIARQFRRYNGLTATQWQRLFMRWANTAGQAVIAANADNTAEQQPNRTECKQAHLFANPAVSVIATLSTAIALYAASVTLHQPDLQAGVPACLDAGFSRTDCEAWAKKIAQP